ncbi:MAG: hypothetical protein ACQGVK_23515 [Myxococcota bacterium]
MPAIYLDSNDDDDLRRERLYAGDLYLFTPRPSTQALCDHGRNMIAEAFKPLEPEVAQRELAVERYAAILAELKPAFIHHDESKRLIRALLEDFGCDPDRTYFDVPRMRSSTFDDYLTTGIAYAFHPHRDTWYSAPMCQINWWLPIFDLDPCNGMAFHTKYWDQPVKNGSAGYNYAEWNRTSRFDAAKHVGRDTRVQPRPEEELNLAGDVRLVCEAGGMMLFSAAQLHSSVPNTSTRTRFSIDFRTVHLDEVENGGGAPNIDSRCTGTTMGDYLRCRDLAHVSDDWIGRYDEGFGR